MTDTIRRVLSGETLNAAEAEAAFDRFMSGTATPTEMAALLTALKVRGETARVMGLYLVVGGTLCVSFIAQLRRWPSPDAECVIAGGRFVCTWLWAAPRLLANLATRELNRGAS